MEELFAKDREEIVQNTKQDTKLEDIKNLMLKLNFDAEKAMEIISIPKEEYPIYLKLLQEQ
jgi:hypothetical protein